MKENVAKRQKPATESAEPLSPSPKETLRALARNPSSDTKNTERAGMQGKSQGCAQERLQKLAAQCCPLESRSETRRSDAQELPGSAAVDVCGVICEECMYSQQQSEDEYG